MTWKRTDDPDLIEWPPYFIRRGKSHEGAPVRYLLGRRVKRNDECLGGFDTSDAAKQAAGELMRQEGRDGSDS